MHEFQVNISGLTFTIPGKILHRHASHICACKWTGECSVVVFELWYVLQSTSNGKGSSNFTHFVVLNRSSPMQSYLKRSTSLIWLR